MTTSLGKKLAQNDIAVVAVTRTAARTRILGQRTREVIAFMLSKIPREQFV